MTIERLRFENGQDFNFTEQDPIAWAVGIICANLDRVQALPEGEYDLTPASWTRNTHRHNLIVRPDGDAIYRLISLDRRAGIVDFSTNSTGFIPGGKIQLLPQDTSMLFVASPSREGGGIQVHDIIFHLPGPSPRRALSRR